MGAGPTEEMKRKKAAPRYWVERKGKLYARLQYRSESGEYKTRYRAITDKRVARSVVEEMRRELEIRGEEGFDAHKMSFIELADRFERVELVEAVYRNGLKVIGKRSLNPVRSSLKTLKAYFGTKPIVKIRAGDLKAFKSERINTPVEKHFNVRRKVTNPETGRKKWLIEKELRVTARKMSGVNRDLALLRSVLEFAFQNEWLLVNPFQRARGIISPAAEVERDRILSFEEEERLIGACVETRAHLRPILICALDTAMRRGEIFRMKWADISFETGEISIPLTNTKSERARVVALTDRLRRELIRIWEVSPKDPVFPVFGVTNDIKHAWTTACRMAGIKDFRLHDCRHTATTRMIAAGAPHTEVMKITGHSQMKTFLRYLSITEATAKRVASKLDEYLAQREKAEEAMGYLH